MSNSTTRLGLILPVGTDAPSVLRTSATTNANTLDNSTIFLKGTFTSRPGAGTAGRYYLATDVLDGGPQGTLYQDNGTTWVYPNQVAYRSGVIGSRPVAGTSGRQYLSTDTNQLAVDSGTAWIPQGLSRRAAVGNVTANPGEWVDAQQGVVVTLPTGYVGALIAITSFTTTTGTNPVTVNGTNVNALGLAGATSFLLGSGVSPVILAGQGSGIWNIISGQQDTGWVPLTLATGIVDGSPFFGAARTPASRLRGDRVELKGLLQNNTGANLTGITTIATIAASCRKTTAADVFLGGAGLSTFNALRLSSSGHLQWNGEYPDGAFLNGGVISIDGLSYSLI